MIYMKFIVIITLFCQVFSSAIPIWELLTYHEKIGNLTFVFMNLVNIYCKKSTIPDCERVLTLYGVSNLLKEDERTLDLLDPHYWNSSSALWRIAMNGAFKFPRDNDLRYEHPNRRHQTEVEEDLNTITNSFDVDYNSPNYYDYEEEEGEPHPYAVKVLPPPGFKHGLTNSENSPIHTRTDKPFLTETSTGDSHRKQVREDSSYIVLLPNNGAPPSEDGISGRSQNSRFLDFRQKPILKESGNTKRHTENTHNPNKSLLFSVLKK